MNAPSNQQAIGRFLWKELRQGIPIALVFAIVAIGLTLTGSLLVDQLSNQLMGFVCGLWFCLLGVLLGSILFASETESRTLVNLQCLPIQWREIFTGKVLAGIIAALAIPALLFLGLTAAELLGVRNRSLFRSELVLQVVVPGTLMYFAIALVMSTRFSSVLNAALIGIAVGSFFDSGLTWLISTNSTDFMSIETYAAIGGFRMLVAVVFLLAAIPLSRQWWLGASTENRIQKQSLAVQERARTRQFAKATQRRTFVHLLWQSLHENFRGIAWLAAITLVPCLILKMFPSHPSGELAMISMGLSGGMLWLTCYIAGISVFARDQRNSSFRYFVQNKEHPRLLWLARNAFWLTVLLVICGSLLLLSRFHFHGRVMPWSMATLFHLQFFNHTSDSDEALRIATAMGSRSNTYLILCGLLIFGIAQWSSQQFRSSIFAGFVSGGLSILAVGWTLICLLSGTPWWFSMLPLIVATFALTWYWAPTWLIERNQKWGWCLSAIVLVTASFCCVVAVNVHQANAIPETVRDWQWHTSDQPDVWIKARQNFAAIEFAEWPRNAKQISWKKKYSHGFDFDRSVQNEIAEHASANKEVLNSFYQALDYVDENWEQFEGSKLGYWRSSSELPVPLDGQTGYFAFEPIRMEITDALHEQDSVRAWRAIRGKLMLEKQLRTFTRVNQGWGSSPEIDQWLSLPNLKPEQIEQAIKDFERHRMDLWSLQRQTIAIKYEPTPEDKLLSRFDRPYKKPINLSHPIRSTIAVSALLVPADMIRKTRWELNIERALLAQVADMQARQALGTLPSFFKFDDSLSRYLPQRSDFYDWFSYSLTPYEDASFLEEYRNLQLDTWRAARQARRETGIKAKMAIICFQLREGRLPETLDELVDSEILNQVPLDPITNEPLAWLPRGINRPIAKRITHGLHVKRVPANAALLFCSPVTNLHEITRRVVTPEQYEHLVELAPHNPDGEPFNGMIQDSNGIDSPEQSMDLFWIAPKNQPVKAANKEPKQ